MLRYVLKRLVFSLFVLFGVLVAVFGISSAIGNPARLMLPVEASEADVAALSARLGLDDPIHVRFARTAADWLRGDFGDSLWQSAPALEISLQRVPATLLLTAVTLAVALPLAVALGVFSARRPGSTLDRGITTVSLAGVSIADFWLGLMLILGFAIHLRWFPTSGYGGAAYLVLPALTLMMRPMGRVAQVARSALIDEMGKQYPVTARAKGLPETAIVYRHGLRNSAIAVVTVAGAEAVSLLNGAVVVETVFGWPGIGSLFIGAIQQRDLPLIQSTVVVVAVLVIVVNLLVDLSYAAIDPRVRRQ
ncbi:ABC transporter permease [Micromonospora sp. WMMD1082]|uniref:ABC transporter permease n=1 Tax=Micromonospora sp. WMMD1082 TaxID=3016104 RepID=UPI002416C3DC|nr:ABC transporter permease [Micromonospora sp. WMMD1082]MDG4798365.1 ABC transporter permease [Micromonospora sp. WMMD1082]